MSAYLNTQHCVNKCSHREEGQHSQHSPQQTGHTCRLMNVSIFQTWLIHKRVPILGNKQAGTTFLAESPKNCHESEQRLQELHI